MAPSAVLVGRTLSDVINNVIVLVVMSVTGLVVGWRIRTSPLQALVGFGLLLAFAYAFSWVMACVGLLVPSPEVFNNASFIAIFPSTFVANTFVPLEHPAGTAAGRSPSGTRSRPSPKRHATCSATPTRIRRRPCRRPGRSSIQRCTP